MAKVVANSGDPDQTLHSAASDLGLHCLPVILLRVSRLQWVKQSCLYLSVNCLLECKFNYAFHILFMQMKHIKDICSKYVIIK